MSNIRNANHHRSDDLSNIIFGITAVYRQNNITLQSAFKSVIKSEVKYHKSLQKTALFRAYLRMLVLYEGYVNMRLL